MSKKNIPVKKDGSSLDHNFVDRDDEELNELTVTFKLNKELKKRLFVYSILSGIKKSKIISDAIEKYLETNKL